MNEHDIKGQLILYLDSNTEGLYDHTIGSFMLEYGYTNKDMVLKCVNNLVSSGLLKTKHGNYVDKVYVLTLAGMDYIHTEIYGDDKKLPPPPPSQIRRNERDDILKDCVLVCKCVEGYNVPSTVRMLLEYIDAGSPVGCDVIEMEDVLELSSQTVKKYLSRMLGDNLITSEKGEYGLTIYKIANRGVLYLDLDLDYTNSNRKSVYEVYVEKRNSKPSNHEQKLISSLLKGAEG